MKNKIVYNKYYVVDENGKRLVRREATKFFEEHREELFNEKAKILILCGATAEKIENAVKNDLSYNPEKIKIIRAKDVEDAVNIAYKEAKSGDIVSLSPASASFDFYPNFEVRGKHFKQLVMNLK